jgi:NAD(P)H-flavin reductase/hemoglobin-like flavoprotein
VSPPVADIDTSALKENFATVAARGGDDVALYFYSYLFLKYPETREMFPPAMTRQRDRLVGALVRIVTNVDNGAVLVPYLEDLGRDHRKFGTLTAHYPAVGEALLATLRHFSGDAWTDRLAADWAAAYGVVAAAMSGAAETAALTDPPYWDAEIVEVDRRTFDIAVLTVRTGVPVPYRAGQSLAVEPSTLRPREWRWYTPANAPGGRDIELHARLIPGGPVSTALVRAAAPGDRLRFGPPFGRMTLDPAGQRPRRMVAGSTGLAPMKALIDQVARDGGRRTHLYFGARSGREVYDRDAVAALDERHPWLTVITAVSDDLRWTGVQGLVGEVAAAGGEWSGHDVYVCGSPVMVEATVKQLMAVGVPEPQIRFEEFGEA